MSYRDKTVAVRRLSLSLLRNPTLIDTMIPHVLHPLRTSWEAGEPWWNFRAIRYLAKQLPDGGRAFEWGSGGSTVWLSSRGLDVTAVESDPEWARRVRERCPDAAVRLIPGSTSGKLRSEPQLRDHGQHFFDDYVAAIDDYPDDSFDVIMIDGICRAECARLASTKLKPGGLIVLDDTHWDLFQPCFTFFRGWETKRVRGFKRTTIFETTFFRRPAASGR